MSAALMASPHHVAMLVLLQVYPPHIEGGAPHSTNAIFSDMDSQQWSCFMEILTELIESALESGKWRQFAAKSSSSMPLGMSCPKF